MGSTYTQIYYHIVFSTKERTPALVKERRDGLFAYVWGIIRNQRAHLYRIGGVEDHIHILTSLHPSVALADFIKAIKLGSSDWIRQNRAFPRFSHWQEGYSSFTHSRDERDRLIEYIRGQENHHRKESFLDELKRLLKEADVKFEDKYLE